MMEEEQHLKDFICDNVEQEKHDNGFELVDDLKNAYVEQLKNQHATFTRKISIIKKLFDDIGTQLNNLTDELNEKTKQYDKMKEDNKKISLSFRKMLSVRQATNMLFFRLWEHNKNTLTDIDFHKLAINTLLLKRKDKIDSPGLKYALAILHDKCIGIDKDICEFYIKVNDFCHPSTKPISIIIDNLNDIENNIDLLEYLKDTGLTKDMCHKLKTEIQKENM